MNSQARTTRRKFLELGAGAALLPQCQGAASERTPEPSPQRVRYGVFSEGRIRDMRLKNRLVRSATAEGACPNGEMTEAGINIYRTLAGGGVGLIITGHMTVMLEGRAEGTQTCIYDDRFIGSIRRIADVIHESGAGCKAVAQVSHAGMQTQISEPVAPSAQPWPSRSGKPRALTTREVEEIATHFAHAARRVQQAGFDGVQIHAAHGYLLSSFLSPYTNTRTDKYGGSLEKRVTIIREIVEETRALAGPHFPILIKMNCDDLVEGGIDIRSLPALANEIERAGIQAVEFSGNRPARQEIEDPEEQSYFLKYVRSLELGVPVILTGGNRSIERLERILKTGTPDFFGMARPLVREPDLPRRWLQARGGEESTCISCNRCLQALGKGEPTRCRVEDTDA